MTEYTNCIMSMPSIEICGATSKGNQSKYLIGTEFFKVDNLGYEGLSETIASRILPYTNLSEYLCIEYSAKSYKGMIGCVPDNFSSGCQEITLYRLLTHMFSTDLKGVYKYYRENYDSELESFYEFILDSIKKGLNYNAADYFSLLFKFDQLILNTDRHFILVSDKIFIQ